MYGERSQVVKAEDCDSSTRGFKSHRSPLEYMVCSGRVGMSFFPDLTKLEQEVRCSKP
ncbi:hypothetical protein PL10110_920002 [Planktothrix agardhii]|nr:hypothetical protein PL10110_920002 [Planktothrix agardhii]